MLHIITPLYRFELIDKVYSTIPNYSDIKWHISISKRRELPKNSFFSKDDRVVIYYLDCEDNDMVTKRNKIFENIKDGYFYLLDDDTKFLEEVYNVYKKYNKINFQGMIIGKQYLPILMKKLNGKAWRPSSNPNYNKIDTGEAIAHHSVLRHVKWEWSIEFGRDNLFWTNCYLYFKDEHTLLINNYISYYNYFNKNKPCVQIRKKIFTFEIKLDIYNRPLVILYSIWLYMKEIRKRINNLV